VRLTIGIWQPHVSLLTLLAILTSVGGRVFILFCLVFLSPNPPQACLGRWSTCVLFIHGVNPSPPLLFPELDKGKCWRSTSTVLKNADNPVQRFWKCNSPIVYVFVLLQQNRLPWIGFVAHYTNAKGTSQMCISAYFFVFSYPLLRHAKGILWKTTGMSRAKRPKSQNPPNPKNSTLSLPTTCGKRTALMLMIQWVLPLKACLYLYLRSSCCSRLCAKQHFLWMLCLSLRNFQLCKESLGCVGPVDSFDTSAHVFTWKSLEFLIQD